MKEFFIDISGIGLKALVSALFLLLLTRLMGKRQISQMTVFDYVNGITIGSIAAEMAVENTEEWVYPFVAMIIYALVSIAISALTVKSIALRRWITGKSIVLYSEKEIYSKNLERAKIDVNELLMVCRNSGYFDLEELSEIILEPNGKFSFLVEDNYRPLKVNDTDIKVKKQGLWANAIIDGVIMKNNIDAMGKNEEWLLGELNKQGYHDTKDIMLATLNDKGVLNIYKSNEEETKKDMWV
ncbi:MAG: DUF421 domain-containing protein [Eubacteriaceae bacterium]|nr:DUF421 domain-containing protein [Eubacteriaceae bacterium]